MMMRVFDDEIGARALGALDQLDVQGVTCLDLHRHIEPTRSQRSREGVQNRPHMGDEIGTAALL
jgi:hypothetical protein